MKPTEETKRFWLMLYAIDSFRNVISSCDYLLENDFHVAGPMYRRVATAILTMYGRPFHKNQGVGKLDESIIPDKYRILHRQLLLERDKIHAHIDSSGIKIHAGNANQVRLLRLKNAFKWITMTYLPDDKSEVLMIRHLCETMIDRLDYHTDKYEKKCLKEIKALPEGEYLLNIDESADSLFTSVERIMPPPSNDLNPTPI